jgi:nitroreductase
VNTLDTIFQRRSIRAYKTTPVPPDDLQQILEAGRRAPSAANRQPWHFIAVTDPAQRSAVASACNGQMWMADAGCTLVALGSPQASPKWYKVDVAIALENMVLAAHSLGYGTCWIGAFDPAKLKEVCEIPPEWEVVACTPVGTPDTVPAARARKEKRQVFSKDRFGEGME